MPYLSGWNDNSDVQLRRRVTSDESVTGSIFWLNLKHKNSQKR